MLHLSAASADLDRAVTLLRAGEVVAIPTETVYGLAGCTFNEAALTKIFAAKERPAFDPLICHLAAPASERTPDWLELLAKARLVDAAALSPAARARAATLTNAFWPGPLTLVFPRKHPAVPDLATSGLSSVAVRAPQHPVAQDLLRRVGEPLCAPSANRFGRISPTMAAHVEQELGGRIAAVIDGGPCVIGVESTVLHIAPDGQLTLLRPGGVSPEQLVAMVSVPVSRFGLANRSGALPGIPAPGMLPSHYAPRKPLQLLTRPWQSLTSADWNAFTSAVADGKCLGLLLATGNEAEAAALLPPTVIVRILSPRGDAAESAQRLFATLRGLDDDSRVGAIIATLWQPDAGLGLAINDRLRRAAHRETWPSS